MEIQKEKKRTNKLIPILRFREFNDEWKLVLLDDIAARGSGHTPNKSFSNYYNGDIKWVSLADSKKLDNGYIDDTENKITIDGIKNSSAVLHPNESVLLSRDAGVGKSAVMKTEMAVSQHFIVWQGNKNILSNWFLYHIMQILKPEFERIAVGSTIKTIGLPYFKKLKIVIPSYPEQIKIVAFLTAIDNKIQLLKQKKQLLEQYKNGVTKQLFAGKLRFKDEYGKSYPKWSTKQLHEISEKKSSNIAANAIADNFGKYKIYGATGELKNVDFYKEEEPYISIVKDGAGVGRTLLCDAKSSVLGTLDIIKPSVNIDLHFLYAVLNNIDFIKYTKGSTIPHIYFKDYSTEKIKLPHIDEQKKIAKLISNIDNKIISVHNQIMQTQKFKEGILQQMFV